MRRHGRHRTRPGVGAGEPLRALAELARRGGLDVGELQAEISRFRLALQADLSVAAAAVQEGAPEVAADVVGADLEALPGLEARLLGGLAAATGVGAAEPAATGPTTADGGGGHGVAGPAPSLHAGADRPPRDPGARGRPPGRPAGPQRGRVSRLAALVLAAAAGVGGLAVGAALRPGQPRVSDAALALAEHNLSELVMATSQHWAPERVRAVATALEGSLAPLVQAAADNPEAAQVAAQYLLGEEQLLRSDPSPETLPALRAAGALLARLVAELPPAARHAVPQPSSSAVPAQTQSPAASPAPEGSASASPTPAASSSAAGQSTPVPATAGSAQPTTTAPGAPATHAQGSSGGQSGAAASTPAPAPSTGLGAPASPPNLAP